MALKWHHLLEEQYPSLARVIDNVDDCDGFVRDTDMSTKKKLKGDKSDKKEGDSAKKEKREKKRSSLVQNGYGK